MDDAPKTGRPEAGPRPWPILVVDDDQDILAVSRMVLGQSNIAGRPLELVTVSSAAEARTKLAERQDFALVLLDVVMETEQAGLELVEHIRNQLGNTAMRIVLRTGQPGQAPEARVVAQYDIDGYLSKTGATVENLRTIVTTSLRTYSLIHRLEGQQKALEHSNRELERFAFVASHDLQTPLRSISNLTQLLTKKAIQKLDPESREIVLMLSDNAAILQRLISDLLEYARVGNTEATFKPIDLNEALDRSLQLLNALIEERGAVIDADPLPTMEGNGLQIDCLLRNLVENAIKFQPGPKPKVAIRSRSEKGGFRLTVADHGIGIPVAKRADVLQMFRRLHAPDQYPGSGMGLALVQKIVELHRGKLAISDTPGGGTTVTVSLPSRQPPA